MIRRFICATIVLVALTFYGCGNSAIMKSPNGKLTAEFTVDETGVLKYSVGYGLEKVSELSSMGVMVDSIEFFKDVKLKLKGKTVIDETYPVWGKHSQARNHCVEYTWDVIYLPTKYQYTLQARVFDDGFAYRFIMPGEGARHVNREVAEWRMPQDAKVWFAERNSNWKLLTYAGEWICAPASELHTVSQQGPVQLMPLLYQTDSLYMIVTEAALYDYSGIRLRADADGSVNADFTEKDGFDVDGEIKTPWRVIIVAENLNSLVNTDIITNLSPAPDAQLFADCSWIKPGRSLWSWWSEIDGQFMTLDGEKGVIDVAAEMGYEYTTVDEGWERKDDKWGFVKELTSHAADKGIGVFVWRHWNRLNDPSDNYSQMRTFMDSVVNVGVKGLKIDFMNGEGKQQIDFTTNVLKNAAQRKLLINFHGCQKPSGEIRTYPNELTREGVRGIELNRITANYVKRMKAEGKDIISKVHISGGENQNIPATHNVTLPFTRGVLGAADYTPVAFTMPGNTTPVHQLAVAYLIDSPLQTIAENPFVLNADKSLDDAVAFLRDLPTVWDETIVLSPSKIGKVAVFARRSGDVWYLVAANAEECEISVLTDFLGTGRFVGTQLADGDGCRIVKTDNIVCNNTSELSFKLKANSGMVVRFVSV